MTTQKQLHILVDIFISCKIAEYFEDKVKDLPEPDFWDDKQLFRAGLKDSLTMLWLFNNELELAIRENVNEKEINDQE